ncbi:MAG: class I SAM-dependent methyltransferase, partial [Chthoniobacterales bacterium]
AAVVIADTSLWRCKMCTLEYAHPAVPGSHAFYEWLAAQPTYYSPRRWEWGVVHDMLKEENSAISLLDIGCGDGQFLELLEDLPRVRGIGLDTTAASIAKCRDRGVEAHQGTINDYLQRAPDRAGRYDVVTAFHCLEHVPDPSRFLSEMLTLLAPGGRLLVSTPYSPMSFETMWFDPLNHPPHHLTRWNGRSYNALAERHDLSVTFRMPAALPWTERVLTSVNLSLNGPAHLQGNREVILRALRKPLNFFLAVLRQLNRDHVNSAVAADVVLTEFRRRN